MTRRARTRQLIELGALVQKARLDIITADDRALLFGALLDLAERLGAPDHVELAAQLRWHGSRAIAGDAAAAAAARGTSRLDREKGGTDDG